MQKPRTAPRPGQRVEVRDEPWLVVHREAFDRSTLVTLQGLGDGNRGATQRVLTPFDRVVPLAEATAPRAASRVRVLKVAATAIAESPSWHDCWTASTANIDLRSWQLEPALAAIRGESRLLLADEVGLGKTIQAGLLVAELIARALAERVLILTPASLRHQWALELSHRFAITATVFDHASLNETAWSLPPGVNPWLTTPVIVSSIDLVKRSEVRTALDEVTFDILVVDEAHHLTPGSDRAVVVAELAVRTPWVVLATATPHSGDETAYRFLCGLGALGDVSGPVIYRRTRSEVDVSSKRRTHLLKVTPTPQEGQLLEATLAYARALWRAPSSSGAHLVASVIARRAASSALAARQTLTRRLALLSESAEPISQAHLPWDEGDSGDDMIGDDVLGTRGLDVRDEEIAWLERLIELATVASGRSSKLGVIRRLLRRTHEPVIIFSEYRDVAVSVGAALSDLGSLVVVHGGLSGHHRRNLIAMFISGRARVLVTTDAAGEGLNLQERCRLVVNLELPWNPLRLEQRVGRVDRIGQQRTVHAIELFHRGSFEDVVLANLERRRTRALAFSQPTTDSDSTLPAEIQRRLHRYNQPAHGRGARPLFARSVLRRHQVSGIVMLFGADALDASGRKVQRQLVALNASVASRPRPVRLSKATVRSLLEDSDVRAALDRELARELSRISADTAATSLALQSRVRQILHELRREEQTPLFQASLFDRRTEQRAPAREAAVRIQCERCERRLVSAEALLSLNSVQPALIAAWPAR